MSPRYRQLATLADLSSASLYEAWDQTGQQSHYVLRVHPSQVDYVQLVLEDAPLGTVFSLIWDETLRPREWFIQGQAGGEAVGSDDPQQDAETAEQRDKAMSWYAQTILRSRRDNKEALTIHILNGWTVEQHRHWVETGEEP